MVFNSYPFIFAFLPVTLAGYYLFHFFHKDTRWWLLLTSIIFYACNGIHFIPFGAAEIFINYGFYCAILHLPETSRKRVLHVAILCNVLTLFLFKYLGFALSILNSLHITNLEIPDLPLPTGISFITFQQIAFLADACRTSEKKHSLLDYSLFMSFFPHITSGPIVLSRQFFPLLKKADIDWGQVSSGLLLFSIGLGKKVLIADALAGGVDYTYSNLGSINAPSMIFASILYSLQIYFDFSGYSDMAIGIARMLGLDLPINFNSPYQANNISEFWDRWHITLTSFLTHYIYIPLGGNRMGKGRTYINIMIVFLVSGLWHGASYTFLLWGFVHGVLTIIHKALSTHFRPPAIVGRIITLICVNAAWILFRAGNLHALRDIVRIFQVHQPGQLNPAMCAASLPRCMAVFIPESVPDSLAITLAIVFAAFSFVLTQLPMNSQKLATRSHYGKSVRLAVVLLVVISLFSLSGVSHFIYAYF